MLYSLYRPLRRIHKLAWLLFIAAVTTAGCSNAQPTVAVNPAPTDELPPALAAADPSATPPATEATTPAVTATAEPSPTQPAVEIGVTYVGITPPPPSSYRIDVSYALEEEAADGSRLTTVTATFANEDGPPVTVTADSVALVDGNGNRYPPEPADPNMQPAIIDYELAAEQDVYGFLIFRLPTDIEVSGTTIEWCPAQESPCEQPVAETVP